MHANVHDGRKGVKFMASKSVTLSVRISDEDAAFLAKLDIIDAHTPSEKLRALLASERRLRAGPRDVIEASDMLSDLMRPARRRLREAELDKPVRSEALDKLYDRLPELAALALAGPPGEATHSELAEFEARMLDAAFDLFEDITRTGLLSGPRCHNAKSLTSRLKAIAELADLVKIKHNFK
jgi:Arc/MetJ-type ribon-helix-helix transcriptional regulator